MLNRLTLFAIFGTLMIGLAACGELSTPPKEAEEPAKAAPKATEQEGPYYDLTKDEITSHADWSSRNVMVMGIKLGDKAGEPVEKTLGPQLGETRLLADGYLSYYQKNSIGIYSFKMTGKIKQIEVLQSFADRIADSKLKSLLASGDLKQMRAIFGMEESMEEKLDTMGTEYVYDSRGIRFIKYKSGISALRFSDTKK